MKTKLFLLHGALGAASQMKPFADALSAIYDVDPLNFCGHGGSSLPAAFSIEKFASDVLERMDAEGIATVNLLGYSMGGYVGLYLCRHYPERVGKLFTIATKLEWNPEGAAREVKMIDPEIIAAKVPAFAEALRQRHAPADWKHQMRLTASMMLAMGERPPLGDEDFMNIPHQVLMAVGENDKMVTRAETEHCAALVPNASFLLLPGTEHPVEKLSPALVVDSATAFFGQ